MMAEGKLLTFVKELSQLLNQQPEEALIFTKGKTLLENLIAVDDWLPVEIGRAHV